MEVVAVLGASNNPSRYAFKAMKMLKEHGHKPIPVHPREPEVLGIKAFGDIRDLVQNSQKIDTVSVYVNKEISSKYEKDLIELKPGRVIFNPGAENPDLEKKLKDQGIGVENACTLVLLSTNQF